MKTKREMWAGFGEGKLMWIDVDPGWGGFGSGDLVDVPAVFNSRKIARSRYEDVRRVVITEMISKPKRKAVTHGR